MRLLLLSLTRLDFCIIPSITIEGISRLESQRLRFVLIIIAAICGAIVLIGGISTGQHGIRRIGEGEARYSARWAWFYGDGWDYGYEDRIRAVDQITLRGYVWGAGEWAVRHSGEITIRIDDTLVLDEPAPQTPTLTGITPPNAASHYQIEMTYRVKAETPFEVGIYERTLFGWQLIPQHRLYHRPPAADTAAHEEAIFIVTRLALLGLVASLMSLCVSFVWTFRSRVELRIFIGVVLLALLVRGVLLVNRADADPWFFTALSGSDNYVLMARQTLGGDPRFIDGTYGNPGMTLWLTSLMSLFGPQIWKAYALGAVASAVSIGMLTIAASRILPARGKQLMLMTGILGVVYPPLVFYQTTLQTVAIETILLPFVMLVMLRPPSLPQSFISGMAIGVLSVARPTALALVGASLVGLLFSRLHWRSRLIASLLTGIGVMAILLPMTLPRTLSTGRYGLVNTQMPLILYVANNRDADGTLGYSERFKLTQAQGKPYAQALREEVLADPARFILLQLHKLGLVFGSRELVNNVDYDFQGRGVSPLLNALSLGGFFGMTLLTGISVFGAARLLLDGGNRRSPLIWTLLCALLLFTLTTVAFYVLGRIRAPIVLLLLPFAAVAIVYPLNPRSVRSWMIPALMAFTVTLLLLFFEHRLPVKRFLDNETPEIIYQQDFGEVRLLGYAVEAVQPSRGGYLYLTLYWQLLSPTTTDHKVFVHLTDAAGERLTGTDHILGHVTYPHTPTSQWQPTTRLAESYFIPIPETPPAVLGVAAGIYGASPTRLFHIGLDDRDGGVDDLTAQTVPFRLGEQLELLDWNVPSTIKPGSTLTVQTRWQTNAPLYEDYVVFYHLVDANDELVAQNDSLSLSGSWTTSALMVDTPLESVREIQLPEDLPTGGYALKVGAYRQQTLERLTAYDANEKPLPEDVIDLAVVSVQP